MIGTSYLMHTGAAAIEGVDVRQGRWIARYVAALLGGFVPLYLLTRSSILIGDGATFMSLAHRGVPAQLHFGEPSHFLQVPLARAIWRVCETIGLPVSLEAIFVGLSLGGTLAAMLCLGLIAAEILHTRTAAWIAAILFGTSLHAWTQWNGELYGLALGFVTAGLLFTLRRRVLAPAFLWALSILSHAEFALAAPAFIAAVWMARPGAATAEDTRRRAFLLLALAAISSVLVLLLWSWAIGKWFDARSLVEWLARSYETRERDVGGAEVLRAIKGLLTAYSAAGHFWRDILTGRGAWHDLGFVLASGTGCLVLLLTALFAAAATSCRRLVLFAVVWLLPAHVLVNWWFVPTVEKYHAAALPGFVLLVTGGLVQLVARMPGRSRYVLCVGYMAACAGVNLLGAVWPMRALGKDTIEAEREIRQLQDERGGQAVFLACDDPKAIVGAQVAYLRLRSVWRGTVPEIQEMIRAWTMDRLRDGKEPYLVGRWCFPEEWRTTSSKAPFDLFFLEQSFQIIPTRIVGMPISESVSTNPFSWRRGDVVRLLPKTSSQ